MTKKDYDIIAACIGASQTNSKCDKYTIDDIITRLINKMRLENPRFNEATFWERVEYWRKAHSGE